MKTTMALLIILSTSSAYAAQGRVDASTGEILSVGEGKYSTDSVDVTVVNVNPAAITEALDHYKYDFASAAIRRKPDAELLPLLKAAAQRERETAVAGIIGREDIHPTWDAVTTLYGVLGEMLADMQGVMDAIATDPNSSATKSAIGAFKTKWTPIMGVPQALKRDLPYALKHLENSTPVLAESNTRAARIEAATTPEAVEAERAKPWPAPSKGRKKIQEELGR
ncbi:MAG: hypothetical protein HZB29_09760 [Nitrospinae bacterium]|nr:hypothetical protein [Nitrospinota bacterium]